MNEIMKWEMTDDIMGEGKNDQLYWILAGRQDV